MKEIIIAIALAVASISAIGQTSPERKDELKAQLATPVNIDEASYYHSPGDGYEISASPKITPDSKNYYILGHIEAADEKGGWFLARIKHAGSIDPRMNRAMREMRQLTGRTKEPYFFVQLPGPLHKFFLANARVNGAVGVIGRYVLNSELPFTSGKTETMPVLSAVALDFNGVYASIPLPKPAPRPAQKQEGQTVTVTEGEELPDDKKPELGEGPAYQCSKASKRVEFMICEDKELSRLDLWLFKVFTRAQLEHPRSHDGDTGKSSFPLGDDQTKWRTKVRDACKDVACIKTAYERRVIEIKTKFPY